MSADTETTEQAAEPGEESGLSERTARLILTAVLLLAMWGIVAALPETAYVVVGILGTLGVQRAQAWRASRGEPQEEDAPPAEEKRETVPETLHRLADPNVFLADFATDRGLSKETARAILEALGITVRRAVRNGTRTGVGVHRDDLPPLPRDPSPTPVGGVDQAQPTNQQGVRVEHRDGGLVIYDLADVHRHHRLDHP